MMTERVSTLRICAILAGLLALSACDFIGHEQNSWATYHKQEVVGARRTPMEQNQQPQ